MSVTFFVKKGVRVFVFVLVLLGGRGVFVAIGGVVAVGREIDVKVIVNSPFPWEFLLKKRSLHQIQCSSEKGGSKIFSPIG